MASTATSLVNDGNTLNTQIIEATVSGDASSAVSILNSGALVLGNATHPGSISTDNGQVTTDGSGNLTAKNLTATGNVSVTGNMTLSGSLTVNGVAANNYVVGTFTGSASPIVVTHGLGSTPSWVGVVDNSSPNAFQVSSITSTTFTATGLLTSAGQTCLFIAVK